MTTESLSYVVALFDVLGFSHRMRTSGLATIASQYRKLISAADQHNANVDGIFDLMGFKESAYWTAEGDVTIFQRVNCAYASDSLMVWAHAAFPEAREKRPEECVELAKDRARGWTYLPIPCDSFLNLCSEFICLGMEVGLPLRGAVGMGTCILDKPSGVYLGLPLVENAELEKAQEFIGIGFCPSFLQQTVPGRFKVAFANHLKPDQTASFGGYVLDWPRHWRRTRQGSVRPKIRRLARGATDKLKYYENTLRFVEASDAVRGQHESSLETSIRAVYPQFSYEEVACDLKAVRNTR